MVVKSLSLFHELNVLPNQNLCDQVTNGFRLNMVTDQFDVVLLRLEQELQKLRDEKKNTLVGFFVKSIDKTLQLYPAKV